MTSEFTGNSTWLFQTGNNISIWHNASDNMLDGNIIILEGIITPKMVVHETVSLWNSLWQRAAPMAVPWIGLYPSTNFHVIPSTWGDLKACGRILLTHRSYTFLALTNRNVASKMSAVLFSPQCVITWFGGKRDCLDNISTDIHFTKAKVDFLGHSDS